jgi:tetratricopeptide (TPR) repeat protein
VTLAIHDYGMQGTVTYAVMELLEGKTLRTRLAQGPLPWREAVEIGAAIADGPEIKTGIKYFESALDKDRDYAPALVGLGDSYILLGALYLGPKKTFEKARDYYLKAENIDPAAPRLPTWRAPIYMFHDYDWRRAEKVFETEHLDLDPFHAFYLASQGKADAALKVMQEYGDIGPLPPAQRYELAAAYNWAGQHDTAIECAKKALDLDPNFPFAYEELGIAYVQKKLPDTAVKELQKAPDHARAHPRIQGMLGFAYAKAGRIEEARKVLKDLTESAQKRQFGCALSVARIHAALGEKAQAFDWLHKAMDDREPLLIFIKVDRTLESLRKEPEFAKVLKDMRLPP